MEVLKLALCCVAALVPLVLLKKQAAEQALLLTVAVLGLVIYRSLTYLGPILTMLETLFTRAGIESAYLEILLKTVAASMVTHLCADLCRDGGSQALATLVEIAGTIAALLIALPVIQAVGELLLQYFSREGTL